LNAHGSFGGFDWRDFQHGNEVRSLVMLIWAEWFYHTLGIHLAKRNDEINVGVMRGWA